MKNLLGWIVTLGSLAFVSWLWSLVWNYGIIVVLARWYTIPTLSFVPAFATGFLFFAIGVFIGVFVYLLTNKESRL